MEETRRRDRDRDKKRKKGKGVAEPPVPEGEEKKKTERKCRADRVTWVKNGRNVWQWGLAPLTGSNTVEFKVR